MGYNGWKNYETWAVSLWIDNDEELYDWSRDIVREAAEAEPEYAKTAAADALKQWIENDQQPDLGASLWADLLAAALSEVDWYEIAENYLSELVDAE